MASGILPSAASPRLILTHPTEEERLMILHANSEEWAHPLQLDAYMGREEILASLPLMANGGLTAWILTVENETPGSRPILASCETIRKKGLIAFRRKEQSIVSDVVCHGIASVFCNKATRKQGFASRMMEELGKHFDNVATDHKGELKCTFTALYSDIGKTFYSRVGWQPCPSSHIEMRPISNLQVPIEFPKTTPLYSEDLPTLCKIDEANLRDQILCETTAKVKVAFLPTADVFNWHHAREEYVAQNMFSKSPLIKGAITRTEKGRRIWCIWTRDWHRGEGEQDQETTDPNILHILRMVFEDRNIAQDEKTSAVAALLLAAQTETSEWGLDVCQFWNVGDEVKQALRMISASELGKTVPNVKHVERETKSICSLRWHPSEGCLTAQGEDLTDIHWIANERYTWC